MEPSTALGLPRPQAWPPCSWFHGKITREQAERLLCPPETGLFLVRESTNYPGDYTLCVSCDGKVEHYRIMYHASKLSIDEEVYFENLMQLVEVSGAPGPAGFRLQPHRHWQGDLGQVLRPRRACLSLRLCRAPVVCRGLSLTPQCLHVEMAPQYVGQETKVQSS